MRQNTFWRILLGLILFGAAFGYVEAAVVAYLRSIYTPLRIQFHPGSANELFPLISFEQLRTLGPEHVQRLKTELGRELATLCMLGGVALIVARNGRVWMAAFVTAFGVWDISFYIFLKLLLGWPASLLTWDILFLLPVPWTGPVLAPVLVSASMIAGGVLVLWREWRNRPVWLTRANWMLIGAGGMLVLAAFVWDFRNTAAGGLPDPFNWPLFGCGELLALLACASALKREAQLSNR